LLAVAAIMSLVRSAVLLAAMLLTSQNSSARLDRFGRVGQTLTEGDISQITSVAAGFGKLPRLVFGFPSMLAGLARITVYLEPDVADGDVQRGRALVLVSEEPPTAPERSAWRVENTQTYACIAAPGRRHFDISSEKDLGSPFVVDGQLDDATLISIVAFIRSRPRIPDRPEGVGPREIALAPISAIVRHDDEEVIVALRTGELQGEKVTLVRRDGRWVITHYEWWIV
jgi:hypothetical protein